MKHFVEYSNNEKVITKSDIPEPLRSQLIQFLHDKHKEWAKVGMVYPLTIESFENDVVAYAFLAMAKDNKKKKK